MRLSPNELRSRAAAFAAKHEGMRDEMRDTQTFWNDFFHDIFDVDRRRAAVYERSVDKLRGARGRIDRFLSAPVCRRLRTPYTIVETMEPSKMADTMTAQKRSELMARICGKDTRPEMLVRRMLHGEGYRYRLHDKRLPGRPDLVFRKRRKVIFVHGCFWHSHGDSACKSARMPKSRLEFWEPKLEGNRERDRRVQDALARDGWGVLVVWECEIKDKERVRDRMVTFLDSREDQSARD